MGRKSLAAERKTQILEAFEAIVGKKGLDGATLEEVAERAGVKRQLIRHYFGSREKLIQEAVDRVVTRYQQSFDDLVALLPEEKRIEMMLDFLFDAEQSAADEGTDLSDAVLMSELRARAIRDEYARKSVLTTYQDFEAVLAAAIAKSWPDADPDAVLAAGYAIMALAITTWEMDWVGFPNERYGAARNAAVTILDALER